MVAPLSPADRLRQGDAALGAALSSLLEALDAFQVAGRDDLIAAIRSALTLAKEAELLRRLGQGDLPNRDPADWFLDD
ncbi:MAG TPA: hypothetical protein VKD90_07425 [Gemmataceae bacterium]|nr:hypothetical protein [Gemmataceae bacterium]